MTDQAAGQPTWRIPEATSGPLRIGDIVHLCDGKDCAAALVAAYDPGDRGRLSLFAFAADGPFPITGRIEYRQRPDVATPGPNRPTWHWREDCPWHR